MSAPEIPPALSDLYDITNFSRFPREPEAVQAVLNEEYRLTSNSPIVKYGMEVNASQAEAWGTLAPYSNHLLELLLYVPRGSRGDFNARQVPNLVHAEVDVSPRAYEQMSGKEDAASGPDRQVYFAQLVPSSQRYWKSRLYLFSRIDKTWFADTHPYDVMRPLLLPPPPQFEHSDANRDERGVFQEAIGAACMNAEGLYLFRPRRLMDDKKTGWDPAAAWFGIELSNNGSEWQAKHYDLGMPDAQTPAEGYGRSVDSKEI
jgi:hypothetical protein